MIRQSRAGIDLSLYGSTEGLDNFKEHKSPAVGAIVSRTVGDRAAFYVEPFWVNNSNDLPKELVDDNNTMMVGLGVRIRIRPTVYLVADATPRVSGFAPGVTHGGFAIEKRAGGHLFSLTFTNSSATTMAQIARGAQNDSDWYLGFNLARKFF